MRFDCIGICPFPRLASVLKNSGNQVWVAAVANACSHLLVPGEVTSERPSLLSWYVPSSALLLKTSVASAAGKTVLAKRLDCGKWDGLSGVGAGKVSAEW